MVRLRGLLLLSALLSSCGGGHGPAPRVLINELFFQPTLDTQEAWVELVNVGDTDAVLEEWRLVSAAGEPLASLSGVLAAAGHIQVPTALLDADTGGVALRHKEALVDYVEYGAADVIGAMHDEAVQRGIWSAGDRLDSAAAAPGDTLARWFDGLDTDHASDWHVARTALVYLGFTSPPVENTVAREPASYAILDDALPELRWEHVGGVRSLTVEIARDAEFSDMAWREAAIVDDHVKLSSPLDSDIYYWRLVGETMSGPTRPSAAWMFVVDVGGWEPADGKPAGRLRTPPPPPPSCDADRPSATPLCWQHKDTRMLCLRRFGRREVGCDALPSAAPFPVTSEWLVEHGGSAPFCGPHVLPTGGESAAIRTPRTTGGKHEQGNCVRAAIQMLNHAFGGNLSQDRISAYAFRDLPLLHKQVPPFDDQLGHLEGIPWNDSNDVLAATLSWALHTEVTPETVKNNITSQLEGHFAMSAQPLLGVIPGGVSGSHAVVISGVVELVNKKKRLTQLTVLDPTFGVVRRAVATNSNGVPLSGYAITKIYSYANPAGMRQEDALTRGEDSDGDGILDFDEQRKCLDAQNQPTDVDCGLGTDPKRPDSDGDGVRDLQELMSYAFNSSGPKDPVRDKDAAGKGVRVELDCNSDLGREGFELDFDGAEDRDGDGKRSGTETDPFDGVASKTVVTLAATKTGHTIHVIGSGLHAESTYAVAVAAMPDTYCDKPLAHNMTPLRELHSLDLAKLGTNGSSRPGMTNTEGKLDLSFDVDCKEEATCLLVVVDVLGNGVFDDHHEPGLACELGQWKDGACAMHGPGFCTDPVVAVKVPRAGDGVCSDGLSNGSLDTSLAHTCAINASDGSLWCWGANGAGELGFGAVVAGDGFDGTVVEPKESLVPRRVDGVGGAIAVATGDQITCAVTSGGSVSCWGFGIRGTGHGDICADDNGVPPLLSPVATPVLGISDAAVISASTTSRHICAVTTGGTVKCWGDNRNGQLGVGWGDPVICTYYSDGTTYQKDWEHRLAYEAVEVPELSSITQLAVGWLSTCALSNTGEVWCWGNVFTEPLTDDPPHTKVAALENVVQLRESGGGEVLALTAAGLVYQIVPGADGFVASIADPYAPANIVQIGGLRSYLRADGLVEDHFWAYPKALPGGVAELQTMTNGCARTNDDAIWCWGTTYVGNGMVEALTTDPIQMRFDGL